MTNVFHKSLGRRSLFQSGLALGGAMAATQLVGCNGKSAAASGKAVDPNGLPSGGKKIPTKDELAKDVDNARMRYKEILAGIFGHGSPKNRRELHRLAESMKLSVKAIGHLAYTIPGDSFEHIKVATEFVGEEFGIGPFFVLESDSSVGQYYYPIADKATGKRVGEEGKKDLEWPAYTALCKAFPEYYFEINLQTNDTESTYRDMFTSQTGGFHHFAVITPNFKEDKVKMDARFEPTTSLKTNVRAIYYDARKDVECMFELLETNAALDFLFASAYDLSKNATLAEYSKDANIARIGGQLTVPRILSLVQWSVASGPLAGTPEAEALRALFAKK